MKMRMFKSKKGFWYYSLLFIIVFSALVMAYYKINLKTNKPSLILGDEAVMLVDQVQKADKLMLYDEIAAKFAGEKGIYEYAFEGGGVNTECGSYKGVPLWNNKYKSCFPIKDGNFKNSYTDYFMKYLKKYLANYPAADMNHFEFVFFDKNGKMQISGYSTETERLNINDDSKNGLGSSVSNENNAPTTLDEYNLGDVISIKSSETGENIDWKKIGQFENMNYFFNLNHINDIQSDVIDPHFAMALDRDNIDDLITHEQWSDLIKNYPNYFKKEIALMAESGIPTDITSLDFEFVNQEDEKPSPSRKKGKVYFEDIWTAAKNANVNYYILLSVCATESSFVDLENSKGANGVMQMFKPAITDVIKNYGSNLKKLFPSKLKDITTSKKDIKMIHEDVFTSPNREDIKIQLQFGAYYLRILKGYLESNNKPGTVKNIIQAYHDGAGSIEKDSSSSYCIDNSEDTKGCSESKNYLSKVQKKFSEIVVTDQVMVT